MLEKEVDKNGVMDARRHRINVAMDIVRARREALTVAHMKAFCILDRRVGNTSLLYVSDFPPHYTLDETFDRRLRSNPSYEQICDSLNETERQFDFELLRLADSEVYHDVMNAQQRLVTSVSDFYKAHEFLEDEVAIIKRIVKSHQDEYETMREKLLKQTKNRSEGQQRRRNMTDEQNKAKRQRM